MMNNTVILTDNELSAIQTGLQFALAGFDKYLEQNGSSSLPPQDIDAVEEIRTIFNKLNKEYFQ